MTDAGLLLSALTLGLCFLAGCALLSVLIGLPLWRLVRDGGPLAVLLVAAQAQGQPTHPADVVRACNADAARLGPAAVRVRYVWHPDPKERENWRLRTLLWANLLSREVDFGRPVEVGPGVWRLDLVDYAWTTDIWERLFDAGEPYLSLPLVEVKVTVTAPVVKVVAPPALPSDGSARKIDLGNGIFWWTGGRDKEGRSWDAAFYQTGGGKVSDPRKSTETKVDAPKVADRAYGPWVPAADALDLSKYTGSRVPLVRADWFLYQTWQERERKAGYYGWLGLKANKSKAADYLALGDADYKASEKVRKLLRGVVGESGVAEHPRGVVAGITRTDGVAFTTQDYKTAVAAKAPQVLLEGDAKPDGGESFITLPNGLFAVSAENAEGVLVDFVPPEIASDKVAPGSTERLIDVGGDCFRCHVEGLRPMEDWTRDVYQAPYRLDGYDAATTKRLQAAYITRDLPGFVKRGVDVYTASLKRLDPKLTPGQASKLLADGYADYVVRRRDLAAVALELGCTPAQLKEAIAADARKAESSGGKYRQDPLIGALVDFPGRPGKPMRFDQVEERYALLQELIAGVKP